MIGDAVGVATTMEWNGLTLTAKELSSKEETNFTSLPSDRGGTTFDGTKFTALPPKAISAK